MKINLYHTNDVHGEFENLAKISTYMKQNRKENDMFFDMGDMCDLSNVMVQGTHADGVKKIMKKLNYDGLCMGNNELDLGNETISTYMHDNVPVITGNITDLSGKTLGDAMISKIFIKGGVRFLIMGMSPYYGISTLKRGVFNPFYCLKDEQTTDPIPYVNGELEKYKGQYDISILLSHCGLKADTYMLDYISGVDIILGGHSHTKIKKPYKIKDTIYTQAYCMGKYIGKLELDIEDGKIVNFDGGLIKNNFEEDIEIIDMLNEQKRIAIENLSKPLCTIEKLSWSADEENDVTNFISDALYKEHECDFAFTNSGAMIDEIGGEITKLKLLKLCPSKFMPLRLPVLGKNLREAVKLSFDKDFTRQSGFGAGFRGNELGTLGFSHNVQITKEPLTIKINGQLLDDDKTYYCISHDYLQRGSYYTMFRVDSSECKYYPGYIRDVLERNLTDKELYKQCRIKRII